MKKITLILTLCAATCFFVGADVKKELLKPITKPETSGLTQKSDANAERIRTVYARSEQRALEQAKAGTRNAKTEFIGILDSVVYRYPDETNFTKQEYKFDEDYFDISEKQYVWDDGKWVIIKAYNYEWEKREGLAFLTANEELDYFFDDYGKPLYDENNQHVYRGTRWEYTYNTNNLVDSQIKISVDTGDRYPEEKKTYVYDARGNEIELYQYRYTGEDWEVELKALVEYDNLNREKVVENYYWNGEWIGSAAGKGIYEYDPVSGKGTLFEYPVWDNTLKTWVNYNKKIQSFDNGNLTEQGEYFWNEDAQDWIGRMIWGEWVYCTKTTLQYNAGGLETSETTFVLQQDGTTWKTSVHMDITYDPIAEEPGYYMYERKTYFNVNEEMEQWQTLKYKYYIASHTHFPVVEHQKLPANSVVVYVYEYNSKTLEGVEEFYTYDAALNLTESRKYVYENGTGIKFASSWAFMEYDSNRNQIKLTSKSGDGTADGWVYNKMYDYEFGRDNIETRNYAFSYMNDEWVKDYGSGFDMDYEILVSQLVVNMGYGNVPYKVTHQYSFENNGNNEWATYIRTFYYNPPGETSLDDNKENTLFSVSPNPVADILKINTADENAQVNVYNLQGAKLLQTSEKQINMAGFTSGVYIIEVNGVKAKVVKK